MNALRWNPPLRNAKHGLKRVTSRKISGGEKGVLGSHTASSTPRAVSAASANETPEVRRRRPAHSPQDTSRGAVYAIRANPQKDAMRGTRRAPTNGYAATTRCTRPRRRRRSPPRRLQRVQRVERTAKPQLRKPREHRRATRADGSEPRLADRVRDLDGETQFRPYSRENMTTCTTVSASTVNHSRLNRMYTALARSGDADHGRELQKKRCPIYHKFCCVVYVRNVHTRRGGKT